MKHKLWKKVLTAFLVFAVCWIGIPDGLFDNRLDVQAISTDYPVQLVRISSADGARDLNASGTADRSALSTAASSGVQSENWRIDYVGTDSVGSFYKLCNMGSGRLLTPDYYSIEAGTNCVIFGAESAKAQHWYITPVEQDARGNDLYYKITNYTNPDLALTEQPNGVTLEKYTGSTAQKWLLNSVGLQGFAGYCKDMNGNVKASTVGGLLGETVEVSTFDELKAACSDSTPRTIVITGDISKTGTYTKDGNGRYQFKDGRIYLWPNKTIIGSYGAHALYNVFFCTYDRADYGQGKNIIIRNIEVSHDPELNNDNVWDFDYGENMWIDHCTFVGHQAVNTASTGQVDWDKFLTFYDKADYITISDCKFGLHEYGVLLGYPADTDEIMEKYNDFPCVTLADNYFNQTLTRAPGLMRYGYFHSLNNYVQNFNLGYTMHTCAKIYTESCYYDGGTGTGSVVNDDPTKITQITNPTTEKVGPWYTDSGSIAVNCYNGNNLKNISSASCSWRPSENYSYQAKTAAAAKTYCETNAGAKNTNAAITYAALAQPGMPSAGYSTVPSASMPEQRETKPAVMDTSTKYMFRNANSGLYLEVQDALAKNGANVQQWGADGAAAHNTWELKDAGNGYYNIISMLDDGKTYYLDVTAKKADDGTNIEIYKASASDAQLFQFMENDDGTYTILTKVSNGKSCVEVKDNSTASGANVQQWTCNGVDCQKWVAEPVAYVTTTTTMNTITTNNTTTTTSATTAAKPTESAVTTTRASSLTTTTTIMEPLKFGDLNSDGVANIADVVFMQKYLLGLSTLTFEEYTCADMNGDGNVNGFDLAILRQTVLLNA